MLRSLVGSEMCIRDSCQWSRETGQVVRYLSGCDTPVTCLTAMAGRVFGSWVASSQIVWMHPVTHETGSLWIDETVPVQDLVELQDWVCASGEDQRLYSWDKHTLASRGAPISVKCDGSRLKLPTAHPRTHELITTSGTSVCTSLWSEGKDGNGMLNPGLAIIEHNASAVSFGFSGPDTFWSDGFVSAATGGQVFLWDGLDSTQLQARLATILTTVVVGGRWLCLLYSDGYLGVYSAQMEDHQDLQLGGTDVDTNPTWMVALDHGRVCISCTNGMVYQCRLSVPTDSAQVPELTWLAPLTVGVSIHDMRADQQSLFCVCANGSISEFSRSSLVRRYESFVFTTMKHKETEMRLVTRLCELAHRSLQQLLGAPENLKALLRGTSCQDATVSQISLRALFQVAATYPLALLEIWPYEVLEQSLLHRLDKVYLDPGSGQVMNLTDSEERQRFEERLSQHGDDLDQLEVVAEWTICVLRAVGSKKESRERMIHDGQLEKMVGMTILALNRYTPLLKLGFYNGVRMDIVNQGVAVLWNLSVTLEFAQEISHDRYRVHELIDQINATNATSFIQGFQSSLESHNVLVTG
eukprot:TRINITY_DN13552_c0_g1_i10.p1 TRINITY_DN13552_c0_g1~~TRINITY_DN13552_c0_g1_i10.p1  ORF type:complete len:624 (+),score=137.61 TRINITY_DN13552_c0_g1_i10:125-1873(+)